MASGTYWSHVRFRHPAAASAQPTAVSPQVSRKDEPECRVQEHAHRHCQNASTRCSIQNDATLPIA